MSLIEEGGPDKVLSFTDHLQELRIRIIICLVCFVLSLFVGFYFAPNILSFLVKPLATLPQNEQRSVLTLRLQEDGSVTWNLPPLPASAAGSATSVTLAEKRTTAALLASLPASGVVSLDTVRLEGPDGKELAMVGQKPRNSLHYLSPMEPIMLWLQGALLAGLVVTIPMIIYQFWLFISPGLRPEERKVVRPALLASVLLFPLGAGFAYLVMQVTLQVLLSFGDLITGLEANLVASKYMGFILVMMLSFGIVFEFPLVLVMLSRLGIVTSELLVQQRRVALVIIAVISAAATPSPDPFSMLVLFLPLLALFEGSIWVIRGLERSASRQELAE